MLLFNTLAVIEHKSVPKFCKFCKSKHKGLLSHLFSRQFCQSSNIRTPKRLGNDFNNVLFVE